MHGGWCRCWKPWLQGTRCGVSSPDMKSRWCLKWKICWTIWMSYSYAYWPKDNVWNMIHELSYMKEWSCLGDSCPKCKWPIYNSCNKEEDLHPDGMMVSTWKLFRTSLWDTVRTHGIRSIVGNSTGFQTSFFWHPPNRLGWNPLVQGSRFRHFVWSTEVQVQKCGDVTCQLVMHRIWADCSCAWLVNHIYERCPKSNCLTSQVFSVICWFFSW